MTWGKMFLSSVLAHGDMGEFIDIGDISNMLRPNEVEGYEFVRDFAKVYGSLPKELTVNQHIDNALMPHAEKPLYYVEMIRQRYVESEVKKAIQGANDLLALDMPAPDKAMQVLVKAAMMLTMSSHKNQIADFREAYDIVIPHYSKTSNATWEGGMRTGWPYLDDMTGGLRKGDMLSMVGRPARGKTFQMLSVALHGWAKAGKAALEIESNAGSDKGLDVPEPASRMFVSMEMPIHAIHERLAAMYSHVNMTNLAKGALGTVAFTRLKKGLNQVAKFDDPFWVVDGNLSSTVEDISMLADQLGPDGLLIDGGYLVKHPTERDRFKRVAENADLMKRELTKKRPLTVSWQFAKSASKKKKGEKVDGDDVGYSDAIYQVSTLLLGLFEPDSVETLIQRQIEVLKGRKGETGSFRTKWDFQNMDFSEVPNVSLSELKFL